MGRMLEPKLCITFHMIPTGKDLDEFRCDNPEYNQRLIDKNLAETIVITDDVNMVHLRDEEGD
jgi:hypothetical protein